MPLDVTSPKFASLLNRLDRHAAELVAVTDWPAQQFAWLAETGVLGWVVPREYGGEDVSTAELTAGYVALAEHCLTTAFILTQRNGACQRLVLSENDAFKSRWLPRLAAGEAFATVGISHLSTSRQHWQQPAVSAREENGDYVLNGEIPWVTGAAHADLIVTGGTLPDGLQILVAIARTAPGVTVLPAAPLLALSASQTASVRLDGVRVPAAQRLAGPAPQVMQQGATASTGSLGTSALALGTTRHALRLLAEEAARRPDLEPILAAFRSQTDALAAELVQATDESIPAPPRPTPAAVRTVANSLALRTTQALLAASKGSGFVAGHPAERLVRESLFFLVWSCPAPVVEAALRELAAC